MKECVGIFRVAADFVRMFVEILTKLYESAEILSGFLENLDNLAISGTLTIFNDSVGFHRDLCDV